MAWGVALMPCHEHDQFPIQGMSISLSTATSGVRSHGFESLGVPLVVVESPRVGRRQLPCIHPVRVTVGFVSWDRLCDSHLVAVIPLHIQQHNGTVCFVEWTLSPEYLRKPARIKGIQAPSRPGYTYGAAHRE